MTRRHRDRDAARRRWRRDQLDERGLCRGECVIFYASGDWTIMRCLRPWEHRGMHVGRLTIESNQFPHLAQLARTVFSMLPEVHSRAWVRWCS